MVALQSPSLNICVRFQTCCSMIKGVLVASAAPWPQGTLWLASTLSKTKFVLLEGRDREREIARERGRDERERERARARNNNKANKFDET